MLERCGINEARTITLLPKIDLHTGYHGAILGDPPPGYRFSVEDADHTFIFDEAVGSPYEVAHLAELVEARNAGSIVHSARWPVLGTAAWVADTDDLLYPVLCGRTALNAAFRRALREGDGEIRTSVRRRAENMLAAYIHPSCACVLLRGLPETSLSAARQWFEQLNLSQMGDAYLQKVVAIRPAQKSAALERVRSKWASLSPLRVVFCGRDFDSKNGLLALLVMARLGTYLKDVQFVYVGPIPAGVLRSHPELLVGVNHYPEMSHPAFLEELLRSHILFHPSKGESIGLVFLEAAAAGMAVVTARGAGMNYVDELLSTAGALLVDRDKVKSCEEAEAFERLMLDLCGDAVLARRMGLRNYALTTVGEYSIAQQTGALRAAYELADSTRCSALTLAHLPHAHGRTALRMTSARVKVDEREMCTRLGVTSLRLDV